jgi:hypothetical protein
MRRTAPVSSQQSVAVERGRRPHQRLLHHEHARAPKPWLVSPAGRSSIWATSRIAPQSRFGAIYVTARDAASTLDNAKECSSWRWRARATRARSSRPRATVCWPRAGADCDGAGHCTNHAASRRHSQVFALDHDGRLTQTAIPVRMASSPSTARATKRRITSCAINPAGDHVSLAERPQCIFTIGPLCCMTWMHVCCVDKSRPLRLAPSATAFRHASAACFIRVIQAVKLLLNPTTLHLNLAARQSAAPPQAINLAMSAGPAAGGRGEPLIPYD